VPARAEATTRRVDPQMRQRHGEVIGALTAEAAGQAQHVRPVARRIEVATPRLLDGPLKRRLKAVNGRRLPAMVRDRPAVVASAASGVKLAQLL